MVRIIVLIAFLVLFSTAALAYFQGSWLDISTNSSAKPFWTESNPQNCVFGDMQSGDKCQLNWSIHTSGDKGSFLIKVKFNSTSANVTSKETSTINATIFEKGDNGRIMMDNESCVGCSFLIVNDTNASTAYDNPFSCGNMVAGNSCIINWNISANAPLKSEWDVFVNFSYNSTEGKEKLTDTIKTRIVDYKWDDTTGYINSSWNCRKMVNVSSNVTGNGIVEIRGFVFSTGVNENSCRIMNCTKEVRVTEILSNKSHQYIPYLSIVNETDQTIGEYTFCRRADIRFNASLTANQTKSFFVYYNDPLIEIDYTNPTGNIIFNNNFDNLNKSSNETVWQGFFDSYIDFWWANGTGTDAQNRGSNSFRKEANWSYYNLTKLGYSPQVQVNRLDTDFLSLISTDKIYFFTGHGDIAIEPEVSNNQTFFEINTHTFSGKIYSDNITNLTQQLNAKFVYIDSSFSGDNSTTKTCLTNWLSKAFANKGVGCFLGFQGRNNTQESCPGSSDVFVSDTQNFNKCFWSEIGQGKTIIEAKNNGTECASTCGPSGDQDCVHAILINSTSGGCNIALT